MGDRELHTTDVAIVGGGIAGVSVAARLAEAGASVTLLEQESELAFHTTSRSAALYLENEGGPIFHRLSSASRDFFERAPGADAPLLEPMPVLKVGDDSLRDGLLSQGELAREVTSNIELVDRSDLLNLCPVLNLDVVTCGLLESSAASIDVMGLHQLFVRAARGGGAELRRSSKLISGKRQLVDGRQRWKLETATGPIDARVVVNAAGPWGDVVARSCGVGEIGLQPMRRTAFTAPVGQDPSGWPFIYSGIEDLECYFKPEAGSQLLCSLSDEQHSKPCDARAEEIDVALAIERINTVSTLGLRSVKTTWAGLRTFAPDRDPVFGWDDQAKDFLWMVGQGGCGIVSAPAAGQIAASLIGGTDLPEPVTELGLTEAMLAPRR